MWITICHRRKFGQVWGSPASLSEVMWKLCCRKTPLWTFNYHMEKSESFCVGCLFDPLQVWSFGGEWPWMESFSKFLSKSAFQPRFTCRGQIWRKSTVAKLLKSSHIADKKSAASGTFSGPPFWPQLTDRAQNFVFKFLSYLMLNNIVTLKCGLELTRGHSNMVPFESWGVV